MISFPVRFCPPVTGVSTWWKSRFCVIPKSVSELQCAGVFTAGGNREEQIHKRQLLSNSKTAIVFCSGQKVFWTLQLQIPVCGKCPGGGKHCAGFQ